jgi:hypothetical protein
LHFSKYDTDSHTLGAIGQHLSVMMQDTVSEISGFNTNDSYFIVHNDLIDRGIEFCQTSGIEAIR